MDAYTTFRKEAHEPSSFLSRSIWFRPARHIVRTGDTWERVARDNQVAVNDLKAQTLQNYIHHTIL